MRFVSKSANFCAGNLRNAQETLGPTTEVLVGASRKHTLTQTYVEIEALSIQFSQDGLLQSDIDAGLAHWKNFPGLGMEEDEVTPANPVEYGRIGVWDSVIWQDTFRLTDEDREQAEKMLLASRYLGTEFIAVEEVKAAKPWPSYDDTHHSKIASLAAELGLVPEALAYEQEKDKPRPSVIEQLETALPTESGEFVAA